jgi:hypothetical protein
MSLVLVRLSGSLTLDTIICVHLFSPIIIIFYLKNPIYLFHAQMCILSKL